MNWILHWSFFRNPKEYNLRNVSMNYFHCTNWSTVHPLNCHGMIRHPLFNLLPKINNNTSYKKKKKKKTNKPQQSYPWTFILKWSLLKSFERKFLVDARGLKVSLFPFPKQLASQNSLPTLNGQPSFYTSNLSSCLLFFSWTY